MKTPQKYICFLILLHTPNEEWVPTHTFEGRHNLLGTEFFLSYKGTARASDMYYDMSDHKGHSEVLERKKVKGYYWYRIRPEMRTFNKLREKLPKEYKPHLERYRNYRLTLALQRGLVV